ncbi:MAG TPA: FTR1 family protein [Vicinamibacterales bacterium]|nr:FTR1 family protein [Vicinamibacterales bacterium]
MPTTSARPSGIKLFLWAALVAVAAVVAWQIAADGSTPDPVASSHIAWLDIAVLVFREGLECVLVLSAITASMTGATAHYRRPVAVGALVAAVATGATWLVAARVLDDLAESMPWLHVQALTGLLAVAVLLVVMNWFFHKLYWTGWISAHTNRKRELVASDGRSRTAGRVMFGMAMLGFTSLYREGVEVVLFLQSYRMKLGTGPIVRGVVVGLALTLVVALVTFVLQRRLPYRRMLVATGIMLGAVLLVMVGEQAQEMQLAGWLPTTEIGWLSTRIPDWMGLWFSFFPTVETMVAQALALVLVIGSYFGARQRPRHAGTEHAPASSVAAHEARV